MRARVVDLATVVIQNIRVLRRSLLNRTVTIVLIKNKNLERLYKQCPLICSSPRQTTIVHHCRHIDIKNSNRVSPYTVLCHRCSAMLKV